MLRISTATRGLGISRLGVFSLEGNTFSSHFLWLAISAILSVSSVMIISDSSEGVQACDLHLIWPNRQ